MTESGDGLASTSRGLRVPWSGLAVALSAIAIACLGALVVVASVKDIDALSTVALALAVLAFAAQLIVSLAQAATGAQQIARSERVNADTQAALAEIRATSQSLLSNQKELFSHVLKAALPDVAQELSSASGANEIDDPLRAAEIELRLSKALEKALDAIRPVPPPRLHPRPRPEITTESLEREVLEFLRGIKTPEGAAIAFGPVLGAHQFDAVMYHVGAAGSLSDKSNVIIEITRNSSIPRLQNMLAKVRVSGLTGLVYITPVRPNGPLSNSDISEFMKGSGLRYLQILSPYTSRFGIELESGLERSWRTTHGTEGAPVIYIGS